MTRFRFRLPRLGLCLCLTVQLLGCGGEGDLAAAQAVSPPASAATADKAAAIPDSGKALAAYLHDLSPRLKGVTAANARLEHYRIPTRDGVVLDSWVRRPPGEFGQPLVLVFTPYHGGGDPALSPSGDPSLQVAEHLVPYGYAVGFVSVGGTGNSGGCIHAQSPTETAQISDAAEYLAKRPWSNGAIAAIGMSYEGGTANQLFVAAPPSVKTVVPMQGVSDSYRFSFASGAIARRYSPFYFTTSYAMQGLSPVGLADGTGPSDPEGFLTGVRGEPCSEQLGIQRDSITSQISADKTAFWHERDLIEAVGKTLSRPRPSMFFIHSFQDHIVEPSAADGYLEAVRKTGVPLHVWFGQWVHIEPQGGSCARGAPCRGDYWETVLLAWFDQFLKGRNTGILDAPAVQLQADDGIWRHEEVWPPVGETLRWYPQTDGSLAAAPGRGGTASYRDAGSNHLSEANAGELAALPQQVPGTFVEFVSAPLRQRLRLTGLPLLKTSATADGRRANLVATLLERKADGSQRYLNFAALSLNHAASLDQGAADITGRRQAVTLRFFPQDNLIAAGSRLVLHLGGDIETRRVQTGDKHNLLNFGINIQPISVAANVMLDLSRTELTLPQNRGDRIEALPWAAP